MKRCNDGCEFALIQMPVILYLCGVHPVALLTYTETLYNSLRNKRINNYDKLKENNFLKSFLERKHFM
jgi:hypothetical protein